MLIPAWQAFRASDTARCVFPLWKAFHKGKSHIAQALGHCAICKGYDVLFTTVSRMLAQINAARADLTWEKKIQKYTRPDLLISDDFGLTAMNNTQAEDFYEIVSEKDLKASTMTTSNRTPQDWVALFPDPVMGNSALDRLSHQLIISLSMEVNRTGKNRNRHTRIERFDHIPS